MSFQEESIIATNSNTIPLGKYKDMDITQIFHEDTQYFQWMWDNIDLSRYPKFAKILERLIEN